MIRDNYSAPPPEEVRADLPLKRIWVLLPEEEE